MTPYDEGQVVAFVNDCKALTNDAGLIGVLCARMQFDVCNGASYSNSRSKHLAELGSHPNPNPVPVIPVGRDRTLNCREKTLLIRMEIELY